MSVVAEGLQGREQNTDTECMGPRLRGDDETQVLSFAPAIRMSLAIWLVREARSSRRRRAAAGSLSRSRENIVRDRRITVENSSEVAVAGRCIGTISASSPISVPEPAM